MKTLSILMLFLAMGGKVLNARANVCGFYAWVATNFFWSIVNFKIGQYEQAILCFFNMVMSMYGIFKWKKHKVGVKNDLE